MKELKFNEYNEVYVPFSEFDVYMKGRKNEVDHTKETDGGTYYYDSVGHLVGYYSDYLGKGTVY